MKKEILSKEVENNRERVKKLHKSCGDLLEEFGDTVLKPRESYIKTPAKEIDKNLDICLSTDLISGGTFNREEALRNSLFVYICRKNTKNSESMMLIELNSSGKYKIDSYIEKNGKPYRKEITLNDFQVLENCEGFIAKLKERYGEKKLKPKQEFTINSG